MPGQIPKRVISDAPFGDGWNTSVEALRSHRPSAGPGILTTHTPHGVMHEAAIVPAAYGNPGNPPVRLRVKSVEANHLVCRSWDGTTEGADDIKVAKNFLLRNSIIARTIAGQNFTYAYNAPAWRIANGPGILEEQVVIPYFVLNDEIYADECDTGVTVGAEKLTLLDQNRDGRAWARKANS